jgi:hypothetical protein
MVPDISHMILQQHRALTIVMMPIAGDDKGMPLTKVMFSPQTLSDQLVCFDQRSLLSQHIIFVGPCMNNKQSSAYNRHFYSSQNTNTMGFTDLKVNTHFT